MFADRIDAGQRLAQRLGRFRGTDGVVLALPRGGVPVAAVIARALELPLDLLFVRKIGLADHAEIALAAIAGPDGEEMVINTAVARAVGVDEARITTLAEKERTELRRRRAIYGAPGLPVSGRTAIIVDDGIATGATVRAAAKAVRLQLPARLVLAVPVAAPQALAELRGSFDEIECLETPKRFVAVGAHYAQFPQVTDQEVKDLLCAGN